MKVIIAGTRTVLDPALVELAMARCGFEVEEVVSGGCPGPDLLGEAWAARNGKLVKRFPADWDRWGRAAGPRRNVQMAEYADALVAVWDGASSGTGHMIRQMRSRKKPVFILQVDAARGAVGWSRWAYRW